MFTHKVFITANTYYESTISHCNKIWDGFDTFRLAPSLPLIDLR